MGNENRKDKLSSRIMYVVRKCPLFQNLDRISFQKVRRVRLLGKRIFLYQAVTSTNTVAAKIAKAGACEGTMVMSESQITGRGRMNRVWTCPPGKGILFSIILRPPISIPDMPQLTLLTGVVVADCIKKFTGCNPGIKWPNDVLINGKKVCGILAESSLLGKYLDFVVIGIGINVNLNKNDFPEEFRETSTSLKLEVDRELDRIQLMRQFIESWQDHYQQFLNEGKDYVRRKWIAKNVTLGHNVILNKEDPVRGFAMDLGENGGLVVRFSDGTIQEYFAGDVVRE